MYRIRGKTERVATSIRGGGEGIPEQGPKTQPGNLLSLIKNNIVLSALRPTQDHLKKEANKKSKRKLERKESEGFG